MDEHSEKLEEEWGLALSCEERALFIASTVPQPPPQPTPATSPPAVDPAASAASANTDADVIAAEIVASYSNAWDLITVRLKEITDLYDKLIWWIGWFKYVGIRTHDRNYNSMMTNRRTVADRFDALMAPFIKPDAPRLHEASLWLDSHRSDWRGMQNICNLFMEEISFLCERSESIQNTLNLVIGWILSIFAFLLPMIVSALISGYSIYLAHQDAKDAKPKPGEETAAQAIHSEIRTLTSDKGDLKVIEAKLDTIVTDFEDIHLKINSILNAIQDTTQGDDKNVSARLKAINEGLEDIKKAIDNNTANEGDIVIKIDALSTAIANLNSSVKNIPGPPSDIPAISAEITRLNKSVRDLRATIENKQFPEIKQDNRSIFNFGN